jgi:hypothetical protein
VVSYIFIFAVLLLSLFSIKNRFARLNNNIIYYIILPFFLCFGYMTGSDWRGYEMDFDYSLADIFYSYREKGYGLLGYIFKLLGLNFWHYAIFVKLIGFYLFLYLYRIYSPNNYLGFIFFFVNFALFLWIDHPARNFCAIIIYLCSLKYIYERKFVKYSLICLLALLFHLTALFFIPIYFLHRIYSKKMYWRFIILSVFIYCFSSSFLPLIDKLFSNIPFYIRYNPYLNELYTDSTMSFLRFFFNIGILSLSIIYKDHIEKKFQYARLIMNLSFIYLLFFSIGNVNTIFFRFNLYLAFTFCILISYLSVCLTSFRKSSFSIFIIILSFIIMINLITKDYRYIPYTNYVEYLFQEKPSYRERSNYNTINSPY